LPFAPIEMSGMFEVGNYVIPKPDIHGRRAEERGRPVRPVATHAHVVDCHDERKSEITIFAPTKHTKSRMTPPKSIGRQSKEFHVLSVAAATRIRPDLAEGRPFRSSLVILMPMPSLAISKIAYRRYKPFI
jgi:hypothetical protein